MAFMANIHIEFSPIKQMIQVSDQLDRATQIHMRKDAIHQYRNQLLSKQLNCAIQPSMFSQTEQGKPFLRDFPKFYFNHSHSQKHYALAMSHQMKDLGIDIEDLDRQVRFEALAKHAFHPDEFSMWQSLEEDPLYWFKVWTTKEAVLKANGLGIRMNLKELNTKLHPLHNGGMLEHESLGIFAYQNIQLANTMLTVAWRSEQSCKGFALPQIEIHQH
ncbi:4'-phosphopantetheinyl transferase superfamily protein [Acinetobacter sp. 187]|nr:4'-phosphopantetheinyl transferase superfamily protein [Acinetobacter lanii]